MFGNRLLVFGAGVVVGVMGARFLISHPQGRLLSKAAIKRGFALTDWLARQVELLREDLADLVAEARAERDGELGGNGAASAGTDA